MAARDIVGTEWTSTRQQVYDDWAQLCTWLQAGVDKRRPQLGRVGVMHKVVDGVRALEALGRVPVGSGNLAEQLWLDMIAHTQEDLGATARTNYRASARTLYQTPVP